MEKKKNKEYLTKFFIVQLCSLFLIICIYLFFNQDFIYESEKVGSNMLGFSGYDIIFGCVKNYKQIVGPNRFIEHQYTYHGSPILIASFVCLTIGSILIFINPAFKYSKTKFNKIWPILNLIGAGLIFLSAFPILFSKRLFIIANMHLNDTTVVEDYPFRSIGINVTFVLIFMTSLIAATNSLEFFIKPNKEEIISA